MSLAIGLGAGTADVNLDHTLHEVIAKPTYERLGDYFKERCAGWTCFVFSGNRYLTGSIGLKASRRTPFYNADIECRLLKYEMWKGTKGG